MKKEKLVIVKIGGKIVDNEQKLAILLKQFAKIEELKILVHGGGMTASSLLQQLGIQPNMVDGRRVTDARTLKVVQMVYTGLNAEIVTLLQSLHCNAIGMTGADGNSIIARKRPVGKVDYGFVGDVTKINPQIIISVLDKAVPVFCALTHDSLGQIYNTNADTIASELGKGLATHFSVDLVYCFGFNGVLEKPEDASSVIPEINPQIYKELVSKNIISDGMIPKLDNAFDALNRGVKKVYITHYTALDYTKTKTGTWVTI